VIEDESIGAEPASATILIRLRFVYIQRMTRRFVGIDDDLLAIAQGSLGTTTIKATVNEALRLAGASRVSPIEKALDDLAMMTTIDRADPWH
jgi:Arc/MetJ family transcription regulator